MICFDTNIVIYIANQTIQETIADMGEMVYPSVVRVESLGYTDITVGEERNIRELLETIHECTMTDAVIERAIRLRQTKKMSLGDAIVAATAIEENCELWTANTKDFADIKGLVVHNPLED